MVGKDAHPTINLKNQIVNLNFGDCHDFAVAKSCNDNANSLRQQTKPNHIKFNLNL